MPEPDLSADANAHIVTLCRLACQVPRAVRVIVIPLPLLAQRGAVFCEVLTVGGSWWLPLSGN